MFDFSSKVHYKSNVATIIKKTSPNRNNNRLRPHIFLKVYYQLSPHFGDVALFFTPQIPSYVPSLCSGGAANLYWSHRVYDFAGLSPPVSPPRKLVSLVKLSWGSFERQKTTGGRWGRDICFYSPSWPPRKLAWLNGWPTRHVGLLGCCSQLFGGVR